MGQQPLLSWDCSSLDAREERRGEESSSRFRQWRRLWSTMVYGLVVDGGEVVRF